MTDQFIEYLSAEAEAKITDALRPYLVTGCPRCNGAMCWMDNLHCGLCGMDPRVEGPFAPTRLQGFNTWAGTRTTDMHLVSWGPTIDPDPPGTILAVHDPGHYLRTRWDEQT